MQGRHQATLLRVLPSDHGVTQDVLNSPCWIMWPPMFSTVYQGNSVETVWQVFMGGTLSLACASTPESWKERQVWSISQELCTNMKQGEPFFWVWECGSPIETQGLRHQLRASLEGRMAASGLTLLGVPVHFHPQGCPHLLTTIKPWSLQQPPWGIPEPYLVCPIRICFATLASSKWLLPCLLFMTFH